MKFTKMQGVGNDFVLFNGFKYKLEEIVPNIKKICDRRFGVGADGIMIALPSEKSDVKMYYYNSDGSQGEMCGNGIRCFSKFVYEKGIVTKKNNFTVETLAGVQNIKLEIKNNEVKKIEVEIVNPRFKPKEIPILLEGEDAFNKELEIDGKKIKFSAIYLGVPHSVIVMKAEDEFNINEIGSKIESHPLFPKKINVNFIYVESNEKIKIYTWERGAGRTLACGTGSCSAGLVANKLGLVGEKVEVITEGGKLEVKILENSVLLKGEAKITFEGELKDI